MAEWSGCPTLKPPEGAIQFTFAPIGFPMQIGWCWAFVLRKDEAGVRSVHRFQPDRDGYPCLIADYAGTFRFDDGEKITEVKL